jgi:hypothetical protein
MLNAEKNSRNELPCDMELVDHPGCLIAALPPTYTINLDNFACHCNMDDLYYLPHRCSRKLMTTTKGVYEDVIVSSQSIIWHPMKNGGLKILGPISLRLATL